MCLLLHRWTRWEQYKREYISIVPIYRHNKITHTEERPVKETRQKRACLCCGYVEDRYING